MISFGIDSAGFNNQLRCGTINFFDGWVVNSEKRNPIKAVAFYVGDNQIGIIPVMRERPDLVSTFGISNLGFFGYCDIPATYFNKILELYAVANDGSKNFLQSYELNNLISDEEKEFRVSNKLPDDLLMALVVHTIDPLSFLEEGKAGVNKIKTVLYENGYDVLTMKNILDFGVGCGRIMRWWQEYASYINFWGCDINPDLINWCTTNLPFGEFTVNPLHPPTIYKKNQFDLIYLFSVFTHLAKETQLEWLREFSRILIPGGLLMVTVHGDYHAKYLPEECVNIYSKNGYYIMTKNAEGENVCASYQSRNFCEKLFSKHFKIINYYSEVFRTCGYQDLYLLEKK